MSIKKVLIVLEVQNVFMSASLRSNTLSKATSKLEDKYAVNFRPGYKSTLDILFDKQKDFFEIAIWSSLPRTPVLDLAKILLKDKVSDLLFITATKNLGSASQDTFLKTMQIEKDIQAMSSQFPEFNQNNTLILSNHENLIPKFRKNEIILPSFSRQRLGADQENDYYMLVLQKYISGLREGCLTKNLNDIRKYTQVMNFDILHQRMKGAALGEIEYR